VAIWTASQISLGLKSHQLLGRYRTEAPAERSRAEWLRLGDRL
jgi:hypothetical protein